MYYEYRLTQKFSDALWLTGGGGLKRILTHLYSTKYNEINIFHSGAQKHVSYTGSHEGFLIYYRLWMETAGNVILNCVSWFVSVILHFNAVLSASCVLLKGTHTPQKIQKNAEIDALV